MRRVLSLFKAAMDYAIRRQWVHRANVLTLVLKEYGGGTPPKIRTFTTDEVRHLIATAASRPPGFVEQSAAYLRCCIYLAAFCGLRRGEIEALKVEHVDFGRGLIEVRHSMTAVGELKGPKTAAGVRDVPMPQVLEDELKLWLRNHLIADPRGLMFRTKGGAAVGVRNFHANHWRPLLDRAGLGPGAAGRRLHFHTLRHFCASSLVARMPLPDAAELMGHSSFDMTLQVYTHALVRGNRGRVPGRGVAKGWPSEIFGQVRVATSNRRRPR